MKLISTLLTFAGLVSLPHVNAGEIDPEVYSNAVAMSSYNATHLTFPDAPGQGRESSQQTFFSINFVEIVNELMSFLTPYAQDAMQTELLDQFDPLDLEINDLITFGPLVFPFEICTAKAELGYYVAPIYGLSDSLIDEIKLSTVSIELGFPKTKWQATFSIKGSYPTNGFNIDFGGSFNTEVCGASFYQSLDAFTFITGPKVSFDLVMNGNVKAWKGKALLQDAKVYNTHASHEGINVLFGSGFDEMESEKLRAEMKETVEIEYTSSEVEMGQAIENALNAKMNGMKKEIGF